MMDQPDTALSPAPDERFGSALDQVCINALRMLAVDGVQQANSGHPGLPMGAAPMAYVLWTATFSTTRLTPRGPIAIVSSSQLDMAPCCSTACCT